MPRDLGIRVDATEPVRLDEDCPECGWSDLWRASMLLLGAAGVSTLGVATQCSRCGYSRTG
ncbi:hypothetical protein LJR045_000973 [Microbacterium sp. LjRoot45]|uniref:hypothetical protein n=1 Tax=Microbacterium sp. LjRoot45 TaxID=3342329 RepID=UPI003ED08023